MNYRLRFIDIAAAASFAMVSVAILASTSPLGARQQIAQVELNSRARAAIDQYLLDYPLRYLATTDFHSFCLSLNKNSNQSLILGGEFDGESCNPTVRHSELFGSATVNIKVVGREVKIEAWTIIRHTQ